MERKWWTLVLVSIATFMLLLDVTVVNVALPDIQKDLDFFQKQGWVTGFSAERWKGARPEFDLVDKKTGKVMFLAAKKITPIKAKKAEADGLEDILVPVGAVAVAQASGSEALR